MQRYILIQDTGSNVDGFGSLLPNFSSVPFTGRLEPGCGFKGRKVSIWIKVFVNDTALF